MQIISHHTISRYYQEQTGKTYHIISDHDIPRHDTKDTSYQNKIAQMPKNSHNENRALKCFRRRLPCATMLLDGLQVLAQVSTTQRNEEVLKCTLQVGNAYHRIGPDPFIGQLLNRLLHVARHDEEQRRQIR